jgi:hypothetical protein
MAALSGKDGTLTVGGAEETPILDWRLRTSANMGKFAANDTGGWKGGVAGVKDSSGSFNMNDKPSFNEGDEIALVLYSGQDIYTLDTALIESIEAVVDVNDGPPVAFAVTFQGTSAVSESTGSYSP